MILTDFECELINLIRNHPDPEKALLAAIEVIETFLESEWLIKQKDGIEE